MSLDPDEEVCVKGLYALAAMSRNLQQGHAGFALAGACARGGNKRVCGCEDVLVQLASCCASVLLDRWCPPGKFHFQERRKE